MQITGVKTIDLSPNPDLRGAYTEMYHSNWPGVPSNLAQWSVVKSFAHSIRGMRVHPVHTDYTCLVRGSALYVLQDIRQNSPTFMQTEYLDLSGDKLQTIVTPPGVAHGFYFKEDSTFVVGITHHYDPNDELGYHFQDPQSGISWPSAEFIVSPKDQSAPPLADILPLMPKWVGDTENHV